MTTYIIRRILLMFPTLLGMMAVVFFIMKASPGDPAQLLLSTQGEMEPGRAIQERNYIRKRYGLDKPVLVQFGRWLNMVSPVGFRMSAELTFDDEQIAGAQAMYAAADHVLVHMSLRQAMDITRLIAAYRGDDLTETANRIIAATKDPNLVMDLLIDIDTLDEDALDAPAAAPGGALEPGPDGEPPTIERRIEAMRRELLLLADEDFSGASEQFVASIKWLMNEHPASAVKVAAQRLREDAGGLNRVVFSRPAIKAPDLGESMTKKRPVSELLGEALPITLLLNLLSLPLVYVSAIGIGVYAAQFRGKSFDVTSGVILLGLWSIPVIWAGVMLQGFFASEQYLNWFPHSGLHDVGADEMPFFPNGNGESDQRGWLLDSLWHLVLPVVCLSYGGLAFVSKLTRGAVLENIMADYVRTARAKGLRGRDVLWRHAFRNSLLPLITVAAFIIPGLLGGSIVVEYIFGIEGMGKLAIQSIEFKDQEVVMAITLISGMLTLGAYLMADILYAVIDPRVAYE